MTLLPGFLLKCRNKCIKNNKHEEEKMKFLTVFNSFKRFFMFQQIALQEKRMRL